MGDADALGQVHVEAWRSGYAGLMPADFLGSLDWQERAATWLQRLEHPTDGVGNLVAERDGGIVGFCSYGTARDEDLPPSTREIYALNVHPSSWSTGAGSALLLAAMHRLSTYDDVVLWVLEENARARRFYARHGFRYDGARKAITIAATELPQLRYRRHSTTPAGSNP